MAGFKSYYRGPKIKVGEQIQLTRGEGHHLVGVLRARKGEKVTLFDGKGSVWEGILDVVGKEVFFEVAEEKVLTPRRCEMVLAVAMVKRGMDEILQKATEIGVARIVPLKTGRTEIKLDEEREVKRIERWESIVIEACKQSGNFFVPEISRVRGIGEFLEECQNLEGALKFTGSLEERAELLSEGMKGGEGMPSTVIWLIGPEGDFTDAEYELAFQSGFKPIQLSKNVLRVETAAIYCLSITDYEINSRLDFN